MREGRRALEPFAEPRSLLDYLRGPDGTHASKNRVLHDLLVCRAVHSEVANVLLTLALWPALDHVYWKLRRAFNGYADAVGDELIGAFGETLSKADPRQVSSVAATLVRNARRDAVRELVNLGTFASQVDTNSEIKLAELADPADDCVSEVLDDDRAWLRAQMVEDFGADAGLVFDVAVNEESQRDAAQRLGLTYAAVRKRHQRTVARIHLARPPYLAPRAAARAPDWRKVDVDTKKAFGRTKTTDEGQLKGPQNISAAKPATAAARDHADKRRMPERRRVGTDGKSLGRREPPRH